MNSFNNSNKWISIVKIINWLYSFKHVHTFLCRSKRFFFGFYIFLTQSNNYLLWTYLGLSSYFSSLTIFTFWGLLKQLHLTTENLIELFIFMLFLILYSNYLLNSSFNKCLILLICFFLVIKNLNRVIFIFLFVFVVIVLIVITFIC